MRRKENEPRVSVKALYYAYGYKGKDATVLEKWIRKEFGKLRDGFGASVVMHDSNDQPCWALNWAEVKKVHARRTSQGRPGGQITVGELKGIFDTYVKEEKRQKLEQAAPVAPEVPEVSEVPEVAEVSPAEIPAREGIDAEKIYSETLPIVAALIHARPEGYNWDMKASRRVVGLALQIREETYKQINEQK